jgi:uncharacterized metal-binding protein YceD (DUF177 family)
MTASPAPGLARYPLRRLHNVDSVAPKGTTVTIDATPEECRGLAEIYDILGVDRVHAELTLTPWRRTGVKVTGTVEASVTQACVVTLEPVPETVEEEVLITFLPADEIGETSDEVELDPDRDDPPEPLEGRFVDLGAVVAEFVALGLDPYPRSPEADAFSGHIEDDGTADEKPSPFAALAKLKPPADG